MFELPKYNEKRISEVCEIVISRIFVDGVEVEFLPSEFPISLLHDAEDKKKDLFLFSGKRIAFLK